MFLLYIDESGITNRHASQTTHYVMLGMAVHVGTWFALTDRVRKLKGRYALDGNTERLELHAAWMLRAYHEQSLIPDFEQLSFRARVDSVLRSRESRKLEWPLLERREVEREKKAFRRTKPYIHLTRNDREELYCKALELVRDHRRGVVLFGEAIDKRHLPANVDPAEEAFAHLVRRFEDFLQGERESPWEFYWSTMTRIRVVDIPTCCSGSSDRTGPEVEWTGSSKRRFSWTVDPTRECRSPTSVPMPYGDTSKIRRMAILS